MVDVAQVLVDLKKAQDAIAESANAEEGVWQYEQAPGVWHSLDAPTTNMMEEEYKKSGQTISQQGRQVTLRSNHHSRAIDFARMEQRNLQTGKVRRIRRLDVRDLEPKLQSERLLHAKATRAEAATQKIAPALQTIVAKVLEMTKDIEALTADRDAALRKVREVQAVASEQADKHEAALAEAAARTAELERQRDALGRQLSEEKGSLRESPSWTCPACDEPNNAKRAACNNCGRVRQVPDAKVVSPPSPRVAFPEETSQLINKFREAVEMWRDPRMRDILGPMHSIEDPTLCQKMQAVLRCTSHSGADSDCDPMSKASVTKVLAVLNPSLWENYCLRKDAIKSEVCKRGTSVTPLRWSQATKHMQQACSDNLYWAELDEGVNEIWAWHGTKNSNAESIAVMGIDPKRCVNGFYGRGFYAAQEACKSLQYTDAGKFSPAKSGEGCLVLCRIALGEPDHAEKPDSSKSCPMGTCHSVAVNPGKEGGPAEQQHQEFVIFDPKQVYPDFIVFFKLPQAPNKEKPAAAAAAGQPSAQPGHNFAHFFGFGSDDDCDYFDDYQDYGGSCGGSFGHDHEDFDDYLDDGCGSPGSYGGGYDYDDGMDLDD